MKHLNGFTGMILALGVAAVAGCSTGTKSPEGLAATGPSIIQAKAQPSTFELDSKLNPRQTSLVYADVKDFKSNVNKVTLRFVHIPMELKMKRVQGSTYAATLTKDELKKLAVPGQTMRYQANVVAVNDRGQTGMTDKPVDINVKAPEPPMATAPS